MAVSGAPFRDFPQHRAPGRPVPHLPVRMIGQLDRHAGLPLRTARPAAGSPAQRLRRRLRQPVRRRRLRGVLRVPPNPGSQVRDLRLQPGQLLPQHRDLRVPLRQLHAQPHICSTKPRNIVGSAGHLGHAELHHGSAPPANKQTSPPPQPAGTKRRRRKAPPGLSSYHADMRGTRITVSLMLGPDTVYGAVNGSP
jgi:hypothetical protein